jgi:hypothetical protein
MDDELLDEYRYLLDEDGSKGIANNIITRK